ncbi:hypothetical protein P153DRAFT_387189 [Dothidotthia symphoricarpi CBS 119687]|uniref:Uncharacterized protein n=1 Tax=Dothidotthia symphoricarpi CBS 119687 TaxID=1392245 RepID=A0A6A6AB11_9PLEO|nr:uncharacterized protein P153DRAFT_387189 [Dothidotthia symphoricarpi CBS 119687]KAF2128234.1 hypothetical protein P153DRAFT_387189 [Dothidotthia symphoricarpi CBS 119687]
MTTLRLRRARQACGRYIPCHIHDRQDPPPTPEEHATHVRFLEWAEVVYREALEDKKKQDEEDAQEVDLVSDGDAPLEYLQNMGLGEMVPILSSDDEDVEMSDEEDHEMSDDEGLEMSDDEGLEMSDGDLAMSDGDLDESDSQENTELNDRKVGPVEGVENDKEEATIEANPHQQHEPDFHQVSATLRAMLRGPGTADYVTRTSNSLPPTPPRLSPHPTAERATQAFLTTPGASRKPTGEKPGTGSLATPGPSRKPTDERKSREKKRDD